MGFFDKFKRKKEKEPKSFSPNLEWDDDEEVEDDFDSYPSYSETDDNSFSSSPNLGFPIGNDNNGGFSKNDPVLTFIGVEKDFHYGNLITTQDIENLEFDQVAPVGIDPGQVQQFCDRMISDVRQYRALLEKRQDDFLKLLAEAQRLSDKLANQGQESEFASFMKEQSDDKESLMEQLTDLKLENQELKAKLSSLDRTNMYEEKLPKVTKMPQLSSSTPKIPQLKKKAPLKPFGFSNNVDNSQKSSGLPGPSLKPFSSKPATGLPSINNSQSTSSVDELLDEL